MTIGIATFGPQAGHGAIAALQAVERVGRGAIGGFVSFVALTGDGRLLRATTQTGGAGALFIGDPPEAIATAPLAGLISSGPNRPEPLSGFVAADSAVGFVTGHRMPQTRTPEGIPLNEHVLEAMKAGADPQTAVDQVIARYPDMDAGFLACAVDGRMGLGSMPSVMARGDQGSDLLDTGGPAARAASIHNAIHPHRLIATLANEIALDTMLRPTRILGWITIEAGIPLGQSAHAEIHVDPAGAAERLCHPHGDYLSGTWSMGLGDKVAVLARGERVGWLGYEPFMTLVEGRVASIDGKPELSVPLLERLPFDGPAAAN